MRNILVLPLIVLGCAIAVALLSAPYFIVSLALSIWTEAKAAADPNLMGKIGTLAGRMSFVCGLPAGAIIGFVVAKNRLRKGNRFFDAAALGLSFVLSAALFAIPVLNGAVDAWQIVTINGKTILSGLLFVAIVQKLVVTLDDWTSTPDSIDAVAKPEARQVQNG